MNYLYTNLYISFVQIFRKLKGIRKKILLAEFEPGLYNFYKNEDKLSEILNFMEE